jgi:hypothetical protein
MNKLHNLPFSYEVDKRGAFLYVFRPSLAFLHLRIENKEVIIYLSFSR